MKTEGKFILDDTELVPVYDLFEWADALEKTARLASDEINGVTVSTIFFGFDYSYGLRTPEYFETMVFIKDGLARVHDRYATYDQAMAGHATALNMVRSKSTQIDETGNE